MAVAGIDCKTVIEWSTCFSENLNVQNDEIFACQSFFIGEEERRFILLSKGPSEATGGSAQLFSVLFLVPVSLPKNEINVNICLPSQDVSDCHSTDIIESHPVKYLIPLKLTVTLPPEYPSSASPKITLSSSWLNGAQLTSLCSQLDILWKDYEGMPILNTWIDWLEHNTLSYLGIEDGIDLQISRGSSGEFDERVGFEFNNIEETLNDLFRYNQQEEAVDFINHDQECSICFTEKSGRDFYSFLPCKHYYCKECVADFCSIHVKNGTVQQLQCLETSCKSEMKPYIIKEVLDKEEFKRWEQLTFQKGLDSMGDISYCPRCEIALITEENSLNMAHCETCQFSFCLECSEPVHPGEICFFKKENKEEEKNDIEGENEKEFQRKLKRMAESKSHEFLKEKSKKCPVCKVKIIKAGG
ncbi:E3 ubiquitin-protein ligase RNF14-like [Mytilus galloprovincialis]|uniref:E3 ubiquitin-protein ligase RNF14-like n=1 Tax=Mytilus galloprovincialis TaxID=29158 RepID=UPI003F7CB39D